MEQTILVTQILTLIIIIIGGLFLKNYFPSYFSEKGKNLATHEDIAAITKEIERIRIQYTTEIERLRARLSYTTGEQTRLREQQTEALLNFYDACRLVMRTEPKLVPRVKDSPQELAKQLSEVEDACLEVTDKFIRLSLYIPHNQALYETASALDNQVSNLQETVVEHLTPIIEKLRATDQADETPILSAIDTFTNATDTSTDSLINSFTAFTSELNKYITEHAAELEKAMGSTPPPQSEI